MDAPVMIDDRNYVSTIVFNEQGYQSAEWQLLIDTEFVESKEMDLQLVIVKNTERALGGIYRFQVFDSMTMSGQKHIKGEYSAGENTWGSWLSEREGIVTIDTLWKGSTDIRLNEGNGYFPNEWD